jgi:hypothetical protein
LKITPSFITVFSISIKIKIPHKHPELIILNLQVKEPLNKLISSRLPTRAIHHNKIPRNLRMDGKHFEIDSKRMLLNSTTREMIGGPADKNAPRSPTEGLKSKLSNLLGAKLRINCRSIASLLVSCRQIMLAQLSSNLFLIESHLSLSFKPRMFQHKTFQARLIIVNKRKSKNQKPAGHSHHREP